MAMGKSDMPSKKHERCALFMRARNKNNQEAHRQKISPTTKKTHCSYLSF